MKKREIKFRAWDGEQMISPDYIDRKGFACWKENSIPTSTDRVMQYTGLKDKNGKEIYEGDIVKDGLSPRVVEFKQHQSSSYGHGDSSTTWYTGFAFYFWGGLEGDVEVIGNIHENPELLKK